MSWELIYREVKLLTELRRMISIIAFSTYLYIYEFYT